MLQRRVERDGDALAEVHERVVTGRGGAGVDDLGAPDAVGRPRFVDVPAEDEVDAGLVSGLSAVFAF